MGIQGLLPLLKSIMVPIHIKELEGCIVAVDTYSWLHKGALSCSRELCKGLPTKRHIQYCMHRVNLLRHHGVKPIMVFDGGPLPMKLEQENKRARSRKENLARALEHEANGNSSAAYECYSKAVDISPSIAHELIQVLRQENVDYVVAPYEADAQMTFLAITKQVDAIITEDSDLIPFGCPRIIFKMDKFGHGVEFQASKLPKNKDLSLSGFSSQMLLEMCILSGCDYLQSLPGMGLKRAHALITKFKSYDRVIKHLKYSTVSVPPLYEESFKRALLTFKHQRVYDPNTEDIIHLSDISDYLGEDSDFVGPSMPQHIAKGIALGQLDPFTQLPFQAESVTPILAVDDISRPKSFKPETVKKKLDLPVQKNLLTKYFCFASVEAKRKFKAPRISPMSLTPTDESPSTPEDNATDIDALSSQTTNESPVYSLGENACVSKVAEKRESPDDDAMEKNHKDLHHKYGDRKVERPKTDSLKVIVRSKYFKQKQEDKGLKQPIPCLNDCSVIGQLKAVKSVINMSSASKREENHRAIATSPCLHHDRIYNDHEDAKEASFSAMNEVAERTTDFHKINHQIDEEEPNPSVEIPSAFSTPENVIPLSSIAINCFHGAATGKRKLDLDENLQKENQNSKHMRMDERDPVLNAETPVETDDVEKFGSNISHIGHYSEIAEKSVERFVSAISSFKYSGTGSRASGLRAPLKDIRNTCPSKGFSHKPDISKFGYASSNRHMVTKSRRL
ncbi:XPG N-terminal [Arabidopsis thaliana x Arabidopsis arenosa]|uniref:Exonuclease 1 n=2 Tax=Arabidopsis thaliana x Arabidopsis arenosa TaxID=1240361 RepID=A0A8T2C105_9BRAS|nr:XPG N-terminal [Arabidopsis thaliana x Arabidopsis arenosa]